MAALLIGLLCLFLAQRLIFVIAALLPKRRRAAFDYTPAVKVLISARDEEAILPSFLQHLEGLDYPVERLSFVLVSDGSRDRTAALMESWCVRHPRALFLRLEESAGKTAAIRQGWQLGPAAELIAVYDADTRPRSDCLRRLAREFQDPKVGAASGSCLPSPPLEGLVARYAALEMWVHQLVNQAARDRLALNPPVVGAHGVYRTAALAEIGGFPQDAAGEDVTVSLSLARHGWQTRFLPEAAVETKVCQTLSQFWSQRQRWTRNLYRAGRHARGPRSWSVVAGYLDRLVFLATLVAALFAKVSWFWPLVYIMGPVLSVWAGLHLAGQRKKLAFLLSCLPMFAVDILVTCAASVTSLNPMRSGWDTQRVPRR